MDRSAAMLILLGVLVSTVLMLLALFAVAPIICSCIVSLLYSLYLFMAYEESSVHHAQEFENRFWTVFALLMSTALFFASDSPLAFGLWSPSVGFVGVLLSGYAMNLWDRYAHRIALTQQTSLKRTSITNSSLVRLRDLGIPVEDQLQRINACLQDIDQLLIPSTINNFLNQRFILQKEREIITVFEECDARALNYLIGHVKLGLLFYKIKDHRNFHGKHRTELIDLLAVDRLPILTVISRVIVLHSLQLLKLRANPRAEIWVKNILINTYREELSELKTLTDAKGSYFCMNKLLWDDIRSESVRQDILNHLRREAAVQNSYVMSSYRKRPKRNITQWRKVLSDVDDTLCSSGGSYPAGIDKRFPKKTVYPGVLAFYRELDLGTEGPEEWPEDRVGNLVFLSARPHVYKDISEKANFAKFEKLRSQNDGRKGMHTTPSLLAGDLTSGGKYVFSNDFEPLARKKFDNFKRYVSIYPEYKHVFVCDNGQGDVRAGELMFDSFPYEFEALYIHIVQDISRSHGYSPKRWFDKEFRPVFFRTYVDAALHAASRNPPLIRIKGLKRICIDAVKDFAQIATWSSYVQRAKRRQELNQDIWRTNAFLELHNEDPVGYILSERRFMNGEKVRTPYGIGKVVDFDPEWDLFEIILDWRSSDMQVLDFDLSTQTNAIQKKNTTQQHRHLTLLETVVETDEADDESARDHMLGLYDPEIGLTSDNSRIASTQEIGESSSETRNVPTTSLQSSTTRLGSSVFVTSSDPVRTRTFFVKAKISGHCISSYIPPIVPKAQAKVTKAQTKVPKVQAKILNANEKPKGSIFTFLQSGVDPAKKIIFKPGDQVRTSYGLATVLEHRPTTRNVVVDFVEWHAIGYLRENDVKKSSKSLLESLIRQLSVTEKPLDFPYPEGVVIQTPFGQGRVTRAVPSLRASSTPSKKSLLVRPPTLRISLESWILSNGSNPQLYCTVDTARVWKDLLKEENKKEATDSILTKFVTSTRTLLEPILSQKQPLKESLKMYTQYYQDAAVVSTSYGRGRIRKFCPSSGFYEVSLVQWTLANGSHAVAYLLQGDLNHCVATNCHEGYPVLTSFGVSGNLASVVPTTGVHIITVPSAGMVCYLQPENVVRPLKAAVGEDVLTAYGDGKIEKYNARNDTYVILLQGWNAKLFANSDAFERVNEGVPDRDGVFGVKWLLSFLFNVEPSQQAHTRNRSNSITSTQSHSNRSNA